MTMAEIQDMSLRYGGRVIRIEVYVNTDADVNKIASKIARSARGLRQDAVVVTVSVHDGEQGKALWESLQELAKEVAADPRSVEVDGEWRVNKGG